MRFFKILNAIKQAKSKRKSEARIDAEVDIVREYFDAEYYIARNPDVAISERDPLRHFCEFGWREMRDPSPNFSILHYLNSVPEVREQGVNPFVHYLTIGQEQGIEGKFLLDNEDSMNAENRLRREKEDVQHRFDAEFYLSQNPDIIGSSFDPLDHYMRHGWREGRDPTVGFSTRFYLTTYPDIRVAGVNPFWHYVIVGEMEDRLASPVQYKEQAARSEKPPPDSDLSNVIKILEPYFDAEYYLQTYPEVAESGVDALAHFCSEGWKVGKDPSPDFSVAGYFEANPDVSASGINPFWHYIVVGRDEGRVTMRAADYASNAQVPDVQTDVEAIREHFDASFYLFKYPDVAQAGIDPLEHYWYNGWREGRDPNGTFSTAFYLDTNPDVASLGVNPYWHYVIAGLREGRSAQHPGGHRVERLRKLESLEQEARCWSHSERPEKLLGSGELSDIILNARSYGSRELLLSVGHDHYHKVSGGVQLCEHREEAISSTNGRIYLHIHPWSPQPRLAHVLEDEDPIICLLLNGDDLGSCLTSDLLKAVTTVTPEMDRTEIVIHQLLGHLPERIADLVRAAGRNDCWLWLHDFITICPSFTLQRNSVSFCGAPPIGSNACALCRYGDERRTHAARISAFFDNIDVHVLSPSQAAAEIWTERSGLTPASLRVVPHMALDWRKRATPLPQASEKITIGFLGTPAPHKGWNVFQNLVHKFGQSGVYRFVFLGSSALPGNGIEYHNVHVTATNPDAMIDAVRQENIDLVLHWASWPETFSLSTYEAYAGGAYVVTNKISGNVAATVKRLKRGAVLEDESELLAFFLDGRLESLVRSVRAARKKNIVHHQLSRMVHDAIDTVVIEDCS